MATQRTRTVLIGLDAASSDLLLEGCDRGIFPNLAALRDQCAWGIVSGLPGFGSGALWPSVSTGVTPATHGRYFYKQINPATYQVEHFEPTRYHATPVWDVISAAGGRVALLDVPQAGMCEHLNGIQTVDWLVHDVVYGGGLSTHPPDLAAELIGKFGVDPVPKCDLPGGRTAAEHELLRDQLVARVAQRANGTVHFLEREPWDLLITTFAEPHCVGHQCWHLRDPAHPLYDAEIAARLGDPVCDVYAAIDTAIGRIAAAAGKDADVIVLSATGMRSNFGGNHLLDEVLRRLEGVEAPRPLAWVTRSKEALKRRLPREMRQRWRRAIHSVEEAASRPDRKRRRYFAVPHNDLAGAVRVNLAGREARGRVEPGRQYDELFAQLRRDLLEVRNLDTGRPAVDDVLRVDEYCRGPRLADMPDFFVMWNREAPISRVGSPRIGSVERTFHGNRSGDHTPDSVFFAVGPHIARGRIDSVSLLDFAPTIAALHGAALPDADGRVIPELAVPDRDRAA
jgi:predicted AlkP superfamily phosphohydrolase/phosphomutase